MFKYLLFVVAFCFVAIRCEEDPDVLVLGEDNFDAAVSENEFILVEFYAPWCGHCKKLAPEYSAAATQLKEAGSVVALAKVDATVHSSLAERFGVQGYPTLKFFRSGTPIDYEGGRTSSAIIQWVTKKSGPPSALLEGDEALETFTSQEGTNIVAFVGKDSEQFEAYLSVAKSGKVDDFALAHVFDDAGKLVIYKTGEDPVTFEGEFTKSALTKFLLSEGYPLVSPLAQESWTRAQKSSTPLLAVFSNTPETKETSLGVAKNFKGEVAVTEHDNQGNLAERWGASGEVLPTAILVDFSTGSPEMSVWNEDTEEAFTVEALTAFVKSSLEGTYKGYQKSEPIPETNDAPVTVVVGKTFEDIVFDESKDVLVEFYAPWCGHCKKLAPVYEELGEAYANNNNVVIAKIDATANSVPDGITVTGFPTLIMFPGADKAGIKHEGGRDLEALKEFVDKNTRESAETEKADL